MFKNVLPDIMHGRMKYFASVLRRKPDAAAQINGSKQYPKIRGTVNFYSTKYGVLVETQASGLPSFPKKCGGNIFAFHIHNGGMCTGNDDDPFANAGTHYDTQNCRHPYHAGDMPVLFENGGYAYCVFLTDRFSVDEIIGKTVIIHSDPDDFKTQPSGNAGKKIACGRIKKEYA